MLISWTGHSHCEGERPEPQCKLWLKAALLRGAHCCIVRPELLLSPQLKACCRLLNKAFPSLPPAGGRCLGEVQVGDQGLSTVTRCTAPRQLVCIQIFPGTSAWQIAHCISLSFISGSFLFSYQHHTFSDLTTLPTPLRACRKSTVHCFTSSPSRLSGLLFLPHRLLPRSPLPPANPYSHFLDLVLFDLSAASVTGDLLLFFSSN